MEDTWQLMCAPPEGLSSLAQVGIKAGSAEAQAERRTDAQ